MTPLSLRETAHRVHDYRHLVRRWRAISRGAGLKLEEFARQGEYPVYCVRTAADPAAGGLYISAGIHGDEPAGSEGLACWAEANLAAHARGPLPLFLLPCLNPWGLVNNQRADERGRDLNRIFDRRVAPILELRRLLAGRRFDVTLHLHEDYDAQGIYLYEVHAHAPRWGSGLLRDCTSAAMPVENRRRIDGWPFRAGVLARKIPLDRIPQMPEALYLYLHHTEHACTFETPSEFGLAHRVRAHVSVIEACLRQLGAKSPARKRTK
jgi:hypothetical protein